MSEKCTFHFDKQLLDYISRGQNDEAKAMLNKDLCSVSDDFGTLLHHATNFQNDVIIRHLIELGTDIDSQECDSAQTPLIIAVDNNFVAGVKVLLEAGANIDITDDEGQSPLRLALSVENFVVEIVEAFFERLRSENLPIEDFVERLIKAKCSLYHAAYLRDLKVIEHMLKRGVSIDSHGNDGKTALHAAVELDDPQLAEMLIDNGADVNAVDEANESVLFLAATKGNSEIVQLLLDECAHVNIKHPETGRTPLYQVLVNANVENQEKYNKCATLLLRHNADFPESDENTLAIFQHALYNQCHVLLKLLMAHLALMKTAMEISFPQPIHKIHSTDEPKMPVGQNEEYFYNCMRILKAEIVGKLTLFNFFRYREQAIRVFMRNHRFNEMVTNFSEVHRLEEEYPYYYEIFEDRVRRTNQMGGLEGKAISILSGIFSECFDILRDGESRVFAGKVVEYLNDDDIRILTKF